MGVQDGDMGKKIFPCHLYFSSACRKMHRICHEENGSLGRTDAAGEVSPDLEGNTSNFVYYRLYDDKDGMGLDTKEHNREEKTNDIIER